MRRLKITIFALAITGLSVGPAMAARLAGVSMPDTETAGSVRLVLNGIGLRTYSILHVHIYVAALYLTRPSHDAEAILDSPDIKILRLHFVHDVSAKQVRKAWRGGLIDNCTAPCTLSTARLDRFLASLQAIRAGETVTMIFGRHGATVYKGSRLMGHVGDPGFARLMLAVFLGAHTDTPDLRRDLLGLGADRAANAG